MRKLMTSLIAAALAVTLSSCGDGGYRYPCQDPKNWDKKSCNPPICEATGTCSKDLVGEKTWTDYEASKEDANG